MKDDRLRPKRDALTILGEGAPFVGFLAEVLWKGTTSVGQKMYDGGQRHTPAERLGSGGGNKGLWPFKLLSFLRLPGMVCEYFYGWNNRWGQV